MSAIDLVKTIAAGGTVDGATLLVVKEGQIRHLRRFVLRRTAGTIRVFASLDGTNYPTAPLVLSLEPAVDASDNVTEVQGTFVATASANRLYYFFGQYRALKFVQKGATAAGFELYGSMD
jgi:hypothetical protein